jgi:hypothetical protein
MSTPDFSALVARHRAYFQTGATRSAEWRESQLTALRAMMTDRALGTAVGPHLLHRGHDGRQDHHDRRGEEIDACGPRAGG